jgi:hypothetical protein
MLLRWLQWCQTLQKPCHLLGWPAELLLLLRLRLLQIQSLKAEQTLSDIQLNNKQASCSDIAVHNNSSCSSSNNNSYSSTLQLPYALHQ